MSPKMTFPAEWATLIQPGFCYKVYKNDRTADCNQLKQLNFYLFAIYAYAYLGYAAVVFCPPPRNNKSLHKSNKAQAKGQLIRFDWLHQAESARRR